MKEAGEAEAASVVVLGVHRLLGVQGPGMVAALTSEEVGIEEAMGPGAAEQWQELLAPAVAMVSRDVTAGTAIAPAALTSSRSQIQVSSLRQVSSAEPHNVCQCLMRVVDFSQLWYCIIKFDDAS